MKHPCSIGRSRRAQTLSWLIISALVFLYGGSRLTPAQAQTQAVSEASLRTWNIPAGPLDETLAQFATEAGVSIAFDPAQVAGRRSSGVSGNLPIDTALSRLLLGSGLTAVKSGSGTYVLQLVPAPDAAVLPTVKVTADTEALPGELPKTYAGGKVARGSSIGILGASDLFDTPISSKSFTEQSVRDQIAFTSNDIAARDASFTITNAATLNNSTAGKLRGFRIEPFESSYDGYSTVADRRYPLEMLERIEILKGPTTIFTGVIGGVGGTINYVSKKPLETPLTRVTGVFASQAQGGANLDVSRRFGSDQAFGLRVNLAQRDGETAIDDLDERNRVGHIAFNWRSERINLDAQYGYLEAQTRGGSGGYFYPSGVPIGDAPKGSKVSGPDWDHREARSEFLRAALDIKLSEAWSTFAVLGANNSYERFVGLGQNVINAAGDADGSVFAQQGKQDWGDSYSLDAGLRARLRTGPVAHSLTLALSQRRAQSQYSDIAVAPDYVQPQFNIYHPASYEGSAPSFVGNTYFPLSDSLTQGLILADEAALLDERLRLTAGVRYTRFDNDSFNYAASTAPDEVGSYKSNDWSPSLGVLYKLKPQLAVYGNYLKAVETGAVAPIEAVNAGETIAPGVSRQYELGFKADLGSVGITASLFDIERPSTYIDPDTLIFDLYGRNRHRGIELDLFGEPLSGVRTLVSYAYLDAQVRDNDNPELIGKTPVSIPENVLVLNIDADVPGLAGLALMANARYLDKQFYDQVNQRSVPSSTILDLGARYSLKLAETPLVARLNLNNVFDRDYFQSTDFTAQSGAPRTLLFSLEANL